MRFYFTNQTVDRQIAREKELRIEAETGLELDNPFYDGDAKEVKALDATGKSDMSSDEIVGRDLKRIKEADGLIAYMSSDKDIGSCMEISIASFAWGKPVYIIAPSDNAYFHPWMRYFGNKIFRTDYEFIAFAKKMWPKGRK